MLEREPWLLNRPTRHEDLEFSFAYFELRHSAIHADSQLRKDPNDGLF